MMEYCGEGRHEIATENDGRCGKCRSYWINGKDSFIDGCPTCEPEKYERVSLEELLREKK